MMKKLFVVGVAGALAGVFGCALFSPRDGELKELKSPPPPFIEDKGHAPPPPLEALFSETGIGYGDKALRWSPANPMAITLAEQNLAVFECRATTVPNVWDPCDKFALSVDAQAKTMTGSCPFKVGAGQGTFTQKASLADGRVKVALAYAVPQEAAANFKSFLFSLVIPKHMAAGKELKVNDKTLAFPSLADWGDSVRLWDHMLHVRDCETIDFAPKTPEDGFALKVASGNPPLSVFRSRNGVHLYFGDFAKREGELVLDLDFKAAKAARESCDCVVAGVNFTQSDDLDVPVFNVKGNLLMNPSFEAGTRYFQTADGELSTDAKFGRRAFKGSVESLCLPVEPNKPHVLSFHAKADARRNVDAAIRTFGWGKEQDYLSQPSRKTFFLGKAGEWERFSLPFSCKNSVVKFSLGAKDVLIDGIQLEQAAAATPYFGNALAVELLTNAAANHLSDASRPLSAKLRLNGPAGEKGTVNVEVEDFFKRVILVERIPFEIGPDGTFTIPLKLDTNLERGVFVVKCQVVPERLPAFTDYLRITRLKTPPLPRKHQSLQSVTKGNAHGWGELKEASDSRLAFLRDCGIGHVVYNEFPLDSATLERFDRHGIDIRELAFRSTQTPPWRKDLGWSTAADWKAMPDPFAADAQATPALLAQMEAIAYKTTKNYPYVRQLNFAGENCDLLRKPSGLPTFAKLALAFLRGAKRGNPDVMVFPIAPCNMEQQGIEEVGKILEACNQVDSALKFDAVGIHPYRPFPEQPDTEGDLQKFMATLERRGYGDKPIFFDEGFYFYPLNIPAWNEVSPWAGVQTKDQYFVMKTPTYAMGWAERVSAAMLLRSWLVCLKHQDRVKFATNWMPVDLDSRTPYAWLAMSSAFADVLGNAVFKEELRPARGVRAYLFEDEATKRPVAAVCQWTEALDRGKEAPQEMTVKLDGAPPEFVDMLGNPRAVPHDGDSYRLPVSNYPLYIRAQPGELEALRMALANATLSGAQAPLEFSATLKGREAVEVQALNPLTKPFDGRLSIDGAPFKTCQLPPLGKLTELVELKEPVPFDKVADYSLPVDVQASKPAALTFSAFAVRHVEPGKLKIDADASDWAGVPAIPLAHRQEAWCRPEIRKWNGPADFSATYRMAWNEGSLYLLVEVVDDKFVMDHSKPTPSSWYDNDAIQLFFDTLGDAPGKARLNNYGLDTNDYSYELLPTSDNSAVVYRRFTVDHQYLGGVGCGLPADALEPAVKVAFRHVGDRQVYEVEFPAHYLSPMALKAGNAPGFGMMVFDRDAAKDGAKQILMNTSVSAYKRPDAYPAMLLTK